MGSRIRQPSLAGKDSLNKQILAKFRPRSNRLHKPAMTLGRPRIARARCPYRSALSATARTVTFCSGAAARANSPEALGTFPIGPHLIRPKHVGQNLGRGQLIDPGDLISTLDSWII